MKCFYHQDESAVGVCRACLKGLCPDCAADLGHGIVCKNKHEQRAEDIEFMTAKNAKAFRAVKKFPMSGALFNGVLGLIFAGFGLFGLAEISWFPLIMGVGFLIFAVWTIIQSRAVWSEK